MTWSREPALYVTLVDAVLVLAIAFGMPITEDQKAALMAVIVAASGLVIRSQVSPVR